MLDKPKGILKQSCSFSLSEKYTLCCILVCKHGEAHRIVPGDCYKVHVINPGPFTHWLCDLWGVGNLTSVCPSLLIYQMGCWEDEIC